MGGEAYIIGAVKGDGSFGFYKPGGFMIQFSNTRREFYESVVSAMKKLGLKPQCWLRTKFGKNSYNKKPLYTLNVHSKFLYQLCSLSHQQLLDWLSFSQERIKAFLRGFYEAEGSIAKNGYPRLRFSNTDKELLEICRGLVLKMGFVSRLHSNGLHKRKKRRNEKECFSLDINGIKCLEFLSQIDPCIKGVGSYHR